MGCARGCSSWPRRRMEIDVESRCGAGYDEKVPGARLNRRNGYRDRTTVPH